jgi:hypothetical protein
MVTTGPRAVLGRASRGPKPAARGKGHAGQLHHFRAQRGLAKCPGLHRPIRWRRCNLIITSIVVVVLIGELMRWASFAISVD